MSRSCMGHGVISTSFRECPNQQKLAGVELNEVEVRMVVNQKSVDRERFLTAMITKIFDHRATSAASQSMQCDVWKIRYIQNMSMEEYHDELVGADEMIRQLSYIGEMLCFL